MAYYTVAFQGATGTGALALGLVAQVTSLDTGLEVLAADTKPRSPGNADRIAANAPT